MNEHRKSRRPLPPWLRRVLRMGRHHSAAARSRGLGWRLITPAAFVAAGALFVTSAVNADGTDLRPERYADLADLAQQETDRVQRLQAEVTALNAEVDELSSQLAGDRIAELQRDLEALQPSVGLTAMTGPGLRVTLEDAPQRIRESAGDEVNNAIVHQQDIQAVVNALWSGGAEAMTLQGQRVISTTGIKCVGNTVLLHGVTYSPPYVIEAIGDVRGMERSVEASDYIRAYLQAVDEWDLGWELEVLDELEAPAFEGSTELRHARAATDEAA